MYKKILVPTDGSDLSGQAVAAAIDFARQCGASIVALSTAEPYPIMPSAEGALLIDPGLEVRTLLDIAQQHVEHVAEAARAAGVDCTLATAISMAPHDEIIRAAQEHGCDLIFMASHGRRGLSRLLVGSVTRNVLAYSPVPVLVLRPRREDGKLNVPAAQAPPSS